MPISCSLVLQLVYLSFETLYFPLQALAPRLAPMVDERLRLGFGHGSFALFISSEHLGQDESDIFAILQCRLLHLPHFFRSP